MTANDDLTNLWDTINAIFERCGYTEEYALQWPNEKASVTFLRFLTEHGFTPQPLSAEKIIEIAGENGIASTGLVDMYFAHRDNLIDFAHALRTQPPNS